MYKLSNLLFFLKCLAVLDSLCFHMNFRINFSSSTKKKKKKQQPPNPCIKFIDHFGKNWHLNYTVSSGPWTQCISLFVYVSQQCLEFYMCWSCHLASLVYPILQCTFPRRLLGETVKSACTAILCQDSDQYAAYWFMLRCASCRAKRNKEQWAYLEVLQFIKKIKQKTTINRHLDLEYKA